MKRLTSFHGILHVTRKDAWEETWRKATPLRILSCLSVVMQCSECLSLHPFCCWNQDIETHGINFFFRSRRLKGNIMSFDVLKSIHSCINAFNDLCEERNETLSYNWHCNKPPTSLALIPCFLVSFFLWMTSPWLWTFSM